MKITRRDALKYAATGAVSFSTGGAFAWSKNSFAQSAPGDGCILINGGEFVMGSQSFEFLRENYEIQRRIAVDSFYIGGYAVIQKEYRELTGSNPSGFKKDNAPVENVTWYEAALYCNELNAKEGLVSAYKRSKS